jgi:hypothetical protein
MKRIFVAIMVILLGSSVNAQSITPERVAQAVQRTIQMGGKLEQWAGLPQYPVVLSNSFPASPVKSKGYFSLAWDKSNLYVLGVFDQAKATITAKNKADANAWWSDDACEVYFRSNPKDSSGEILHFAVSPNGTRFTRSTSGGAYKSNSRIEAKRWVLELAFPLGKQLPTVGAGQAWQLKIGREHQRAKEFPIWPMGGDFSSSSNLGYLVFTPKLEPQATVISRIKALGLVKVAGKPIKSGLSSIGSFAVYYGDKKVDIDKLKFYDLAIVQPNSLTPEQLAQLHTDGVKVVAYMTLGELDPTASFAKEVPESWVLGTNQNWGSKFINASEPGWQAIMQREATRILELGFDGLFLDTLDTADDYPQAKPGLIQIVKDLRKNFPAKLLVQNRGFRLLEQTANSIDAVMFEDFSTTYDFDKKLYSASDGDPTEVLEYHARGLVVLAMEYALPSQQNLIVRAYSRAKQYGFIPFISTINLDELFVVNP